MSKWYNEEWNCKGCGFLIFRSKDKCNKCNLGRNGNKVIPTRRVGDWICKGCNNLIFAKKNKCFKCNIDKLGNIGIDGNIAKDDNECIICYDNPKNTMFIHGLNAHQICCFNCATKISKTSNKCPLCQQTITQIIRVYT
jgi:hypothetical protein